MKTVNLAKNTTFFTGALTLQKVLSFVYFLFISNTLLAEQLGQYVFALSFTTMFSIFVDLGLSPVLTREASKDHQQANLYLKNVLSLKIPLSIITILAAWIVIYFSGKPANVQLLVFLASFIMLLDSFSLSFWVIFRSMQNMLYESVATILVQIIIFILGLTALKLSGEVKYLIMALVVASLFNFCLSFCLLKFKLKFSLLPQFDKKIINSFLKILPAFAIAGFFIKVYNTSDSVLLSYLDSDRAVGLYAVPAKIIYSFQQVIPAAFSAVIFPAFSYYYANSKKMLELTFERAFMYLSIISWPIAIGIFVLIPQIISRIWPAYSTVIPCFYVMVLALPFIFLAFPTGYLLNSCDRQNQTTINRGIITVLAVILNIILIPKLSFYGAGITFFITNFILLFMDFYWVRQVIGLNYLTLFKVSAKSIVAALVMAAAIILIRPYFGLFVEVPFGGAVYFICLFILRGLNFNELFKILKKEPVNIEEIKPEKL